MTSRAVDIVFIPEKDLSDILIDWNSKLDPNRKDQIVLGENAIPHITLRMLSLDEKDFDKIPELLEGIGSIELTLDRLYLIDRINRKTWFAGFKEEGKLKKIHHSLIMAKIGNPLETITAESFEGEGIIDRTVDYVRNFERKNSLDRYHPHITMGRGDKTALLDLPIKGTFHPAAFLLGKYCTCAKRIS